MSILFDCPSCGGQAPKLIGAQKQIFCSLCYNRELNSTEPSARYWSVHDTDVKDKSGTRISKGKAWEIANRTVDRESGKTINRITGKPAEF